MIRYEITEAALRQDLEDYKQGWLARAEARTEKFRQLGHYDESSPIWSEVKPVYMELQHDKCAYCERKLESAEYGRVEHDLEHFRPKKSTRPWVLPPDLDEDIDLTEPLVGNTDPGYHLLAYNPLNYCTSCKTCNSRLKSNIFPIEGVRKPGGEDPEELLSEKPLLIYPVGQYDDDPAELIKFHGISPMVCGETEHKRHRGLVTIEFFALDDTKRKNLLRERADVIVKLFSFFTVVELSQDPDLKKDFEDQIKNAKADSAPHTNCAISFCDLYQRDKDEAKEIFKLAKGYLDTIS